MSGQSTMLQFNRPPSLLRPATHLHNNVTQRFGSKINVFCVIFASKSKMTCSQGPAGQEKNILKISMTCLFYIGRIISNTWAPANISGSFTPCISARGNRIGPLCLCVSRSCEPDRVTYDLDFFWSQSIIKGFLGKRTIGERGRCLNTQAFSLADYINLI